MTTNQKIKGILTNCITGKETEIELDYEIIENDGRRIFRLIGGVTGWESFYIDPSPDSIARQFHEPLENMKKHGWLACVGTKGSYDRLFIPAVEMSKVRL